MSCCLGFFPPVEGEINGRGEEARGICCQHFSAL